jgi:putative ABC transport system permease protein
VAELKPRWRKVLADLWDSKSRTLLVVASIAVGVFAVGAIATAFVIMSEDIDLSFISANPANIIVVTDEFDDGFVRTIERVPGVAEAAGRTMVSVRVSDDGQSWQSLDLVGVEDFDHITIADLLVLDGKAEPELMEFLVSYNELSDSGLTVGETVRIRLPDDSVREMTVAGVVSDQAMAGDFAAFPRAFVTMDTVDELGLPDQFNRLYATVSDNRGDSDAIKVVSAAVEEKIEKSGRSVYNTTVVETDKHPMTSTILALLGVLGALGFLIMLLSSSLIFNTLNALLTQHMRQIGVMKLVGAQSMQISGMYIILIIIYGSIALAISVPLGMLAGYGLSAFIANFMSAELQGFRVVPLAIVLQVIVALVVPLAAGFFPVNRGSKIKIRRAISDDGPGNAGQTSTLFDRAGAITSRVSRPLVLSVRNTFRRKGRLALTLFTLTMAGAIFIAVFNVRSSLEAFMDQMAMHFMADITVNFDQPYRNSKVEQALMEVPGIQHVEGWQRAWAEIRGPNDEALTDLIIFAPPVGSALIEPDLVAGRWLEPGDRNGLVVADSLLTDYPDLQPGDTLRISVADGRAEEWTVLGIFRFTDMIGAQLTYTDYDSLADVLNLPGQTSSFRMVAGARTLEAQKALSGVVDAHMRDLGYKVSDVEAGLVTRQDNSQAINILVIFLLMMALLTAFVGSIGLAGTMGMNVLERTREIGVMRAIGAVDLDIIKSVVVEGALIGLISWAFAVVLSFPISYGLLYIVGNAMIQAVMPMALTPWGIIIWLGVVLALAVVASMVPARSAARLTIREVLAYE